MIRAQHLVHHVDPVKKRVAVEYGATWLLLGVTVPIEFLSNLVLEVIDDRVFVSFL